MCFMHEKDIREKIDALLEKANAIKYIDSQHTIEIANDALCLCEKIGYTLGENVAKSYMGYAYNNIGNYEKRRLEKIFKTKMAELNIYINSQKFQIG